MSVEQIIPRAQLFRYFRHESRNNNNDRSKISKAMNFQLKRIQKRVLEKI